MRFEDLDSWKAARVLVNGIYRLTKNEDLSRDFGLCNQIQRAAVSILSNIAEGFERYHVQEKLQFLNIARASAGEVRSLLYVIEDNYPSHSSSSQELRTESIRVGQLISGLIRSTESRR